MTKPELQPFAPLELTARGQIVGALIERRHALGWTGADLDDRAGWADRYGAKLEAPLRPQGKTGFHFDAPTEVCPSGSLRCSGMAEVWLHALGLRLVLVDAATAKAIGAVSAPVTAPTGKRNFADGSASAGHAARRQQHGKRSVVTIAGYEAADRTLVASLSFKVAVTDHPFLEARPDLKAEAERIEAGLAALADRIREAA